MFRRSSTPPVYVGMDYQITESPPWRKGDEATTELLQDIDGFIKEYRSIDDATRKMFAEKDFSRAMTVDYIFNSNIGELVGTQTEDDTQRVLEDIWEKRRTTLKPSKTRLETENTYKAMDELHNTIKPGMESLGLLTVDTICDVHRILMKGLHPRNGLIRNCQVYTEYNDETHIYPDPYDADLRFYGLIDQYNKSILKLNEQKANNDHTENMFKCAARLLFEFVDAHPFNDGNGRMCRLLANHVLSHITPFPVGIYHAKHHPNSCSQSDYIDAIVKCRNNPTKGPGDLAAMLIDGAWIAWKSLFENLKRLFGPASHRIGLVIRRSEKEKVSQKVQQIQPFLEKKGITVEQEDACCYKSH